MKVTDPPIEAVPGQHNHLIVDVDAAGQVTCDSNIEQLLFRCYLYFMCVEELVSLPRAVRVCNHSTGGASRDRDTITILASRPYLDKQVVVARSW